jgi:hypothetical protein
MWLSKVFDLYSNLSQTNSEKPESSREGGLGFVDSAKDVMEIELELRRQIPDEIETAANPKFKAVRKPRTKKVNTIDMKTVSVRIHQDIGALRNRKGDTGRRA